MLDDRSLSGKTAAVAVALLLILTAWGNAEVMLVVAVLGLVVSGVFFRKQTTQGSALSAALGCVLAIAVALIMLLR